MLQRDLPLCFIVVMAFATLLSPSFADQPIPVSSGSALAELGGAPPEPPPGFATSDDAFEAVLSGKVPRANPPIDPDKKVVVKTDIEYGNAGNRPLLLDLYSPDSHRSAPAGDHLYPWWIVAWR